MTTSEPNARVTDLLGAVIDHLKEYELPEPYGVQAHSRVSEGRPQVNVHLVELGLSAVAGVLAAWADTLTDTRLSAWRPPSSGAVHLQVSGRLSHAVPIEVWAGVAGPVPPVSLTPGQKQTLRLGLLRTWMVPAGVDAHSTVAPRKGGVG